VWHQDAKTTAVAPEVVDLERLASRALYSRNARINDPECRVIERLYIEARKM
jgi:hypothetical protein